ncbi:MAG: protein phosphatase 2C domain-containing protein [Clostridiales bacterium]|nr:protein phosphatase 2C domain-containing protein [Clostridiales bacterium]
MHCGWIALSSEASGAKRKDKAKGQDASCSRVSDEAAAIAVADGVSGAGDLAGVGAEIIAKCAVSYLLEKFNEIWMLPPGRLQPHFCKMIVGKFCAGVDSYCSEHSLPPVVEDKFINPSISHFATTLICAAVSGSKMIFIKMGNGFAALGTADGYRLFSPSELSSGLTNDVTLALEPENDSLIFERYLLPEDALSVVIMSDGAEYSERLYIDGRLGAAFGAWVNESSASGEILKEAVEALAEENDKDKDDVSVAVLMKADAKPAPETLEGNPLEGRELYQRMKESNFSAKADMNPPSPVNSEGSLDPKTFFSPKAVLSYMPFLNHKASSNHKSFFISKAFFSAKNNLSDMDPKGDAESPQDAKADFARRILERIKLI